MIGIVSVCCIPERADSCEQSEMVSQLLFGELVEILEQKERWLRIRNFSDKYEAWIDKKMIRILGEEEEKELSKLNFKLTSKALECYPTNNPNEKMPIAGGSLIAFKDGKVFSFSTKKLALSIDDSNLSKRKYEDLVELAKQYLNAPYLWGGKTILGIDCSGLTQVVYAIAGIQLPRDASQQVELGKTIDFLSEAQAGDLAFFENEIGKIIHVGILIDSRHIIHASGWVKIENIDSEGILSNETGTHSHKLRIIKRLREDE